ILYSSLFRPLLFVTHPAPTAISTLSLHDALPIFARGLRQQRAIRQVMVFLQGHGISPAYAARIYRVYGDEAVERVRANPYRLARSEEHTSELQSRENLVCRLLLEKKKKKKRSNK